jgi:hypothetical protein
MNHTELFRTCFAPLRQQKSGGNLHHARRGSSPAGWNISVFGKAEAIRETVKNFAEAESSEIHILALYESTDTVAGKLHIGVDGKIDLYLVDAVTFNAQGKVTAIRSYKGARRLGQITSLTIPKKISPGMDSNMT